MILSDDGRGGYRPKFEGELLYVMFGLTKKTEYALIALTHLAREREMRGNGVAEGDANSGRCRASAREIADQYGVPLPLLMNILKTLTQHGLVQSTRGARGGYCLAQPAEQISLQNVIQAIEGAVSLTQCTAEDGGETKGLCELTPNCPVRGPVRLINQRFRDFLSQVSIAEIAEPESGADPVTRIAVEV